MFGAFVFVRSEPAGGRFVHLFDGVEQRLRQAAIPDGDVFGSIIIAYGLRFPLPLDDLLQCTDHPGPPAWTGRPRSPVLDV